MKPLRRRAFSRKRLYKRRRRRGAAVVSTILAMGIVAIVLTGVTPNHLMTEHWLNVAQKTATPVETVKKAAPEVPDPTSTEQDKLSEANVSKASEGESTTNDDSGGSTTGPTKAETKDKQDQESDTSEKPEPSSEEPPLPPAPSDPTTYLTIPKLGLYDNTVYNDSSPATLDVGAAKIPETGFPWQDSANPYIAGHRIGYAGTESYNQFYNLPSMVQGDEVILTDANGSTYTYRVTDVFAVTPQDTWVTEPQAGRDMVTLQTCVASVDDWWTITPGLLTSPPGPETARLIVQAERVAFDSAV